MPSHVRYLWKFGSYEWPQLRFEYQRSQPLRAPLAELGGSDYALDLLEGAPAIFSPGRERVRFVHYGLPEDVNPEIDDMLSSLYLSGLDWLWTRTEDPLDPPRKAYARLTEMPEITVAGDSYHITPVVLGFTRITPWLGENVFSATRTVDSLTGDNLVINNPGNLPTKRVTIRLTSITAGGIVDVRIYNAANGNEFEVLRSSTGIGDVLQLDTRIPEVTWNGVNTIANYNAPGVTQKYLSFQLEPGNNTLEVYPSGTPNFTLLVEADASYA